MVTIGTRIVYVPLDEKERWNKIGAAQGAREKRKCDRKGHARYFEDKCNPARPSLVLLKTKYYWAVDKYDRPVPIGKEGVRIKSIPLVSKSAYNNF